MTEKNLTTEQAALARQKEATRSSERYVSPPVDIFETEEGLTLVADMPGLDDKSLEINVDKGVLTIEGKAPAGSGELLYREFNMAGYWRQFQVPETLDAAKAKAEIKNGVLTLQLPKVEAAKPKRIAITVH